MELKRRPDTAISGPLETIRAAKLNGPELSPPNSKPKPCGQACKHCGAVFATSTHGRTKRFCSDRCRQAHRKGASTPENGLRYRTGRPKPKSGSQGIDFIHEFKPETLSQETKLRFERVNDITFKLINGDVTNVPASHGKWGGYRTAKAVAWVINVAPGQWLARYRNEASGPSPFNEAKANALAMISGACGDYFIENPIDHLNGLQARLLDRDVGAP
jgi:hypothetical protein